MLTGAKFDFKNKYRLSLYIIWDDDIPKVFFIMYNPSIADKKNNDEVLLIRFSFDGIVYF